MKKTETSLRKSRVYNQTVGEETESSHFRFWASAFYFTYFGAVGAFGPFLNAHYQQTGLRVEQIGLLAALPLFTMLFANPIWAFTADAFHLHSRMLPLTMLLVVPFAWLLAQMQTFWMLMLLALLYAFCLAPIIPLGDFSVMDQLGESRYEYGKIRIWGAVGYGLAALYGGFLMERVGIRHSVIAFMLVMTAGVFVATHLPRPRLVVSTPFWSNLKVMSTDRRWYSFLGGTFLAGLGFAVINNYLILYMRSLGAGAGLFGLSVAIAGVSELPIFFFSNRVLKRWSPRGLLTVAFAALIVRLVLISLLTDPRLVILVQLLHGLSFSALWTAGVNYVSEIAPPGLGASSQALFSTTVFGLSGMTGAFLGGQVYEQTGPAFLFQLTAALVFVGWVVFQFGNRLKGKN